MKLLSIVCFGVLGILSRYYLGIIATKLTSHPFPLATFTVNMSGSFLIGAFYVWALEKGMTSEALRVGVMVGFLGGYTTFSAFCLEAFRLFETSDYVNFGLYFILSPMLGLVATASGLVVARLYLQAS